MYVKLYVKWVLNLTYHILRASECNFKHDFIASYLMRLGSCLQSSEHIIHRVCLTFWGVIRSCVNSLSNAGSIQGCERVRLTVFIKVKQTGKRKSPYLEPTVYAHMIEVFNFSMRLFWHVSRYSAYTRNWRSFENRDPPEVLSVT